MADLGDLPIDSQSSLIDIGSLASWSVSSSKPNHGVHHLSDPNLNTLWQSEGGQPHLINIQFPKKQSISRISIYADVGRDDSYTPQKISIRCGSHHGDLQEIRWVDLHQPMGWQHLFVGGAGGSNSSHFSEAQLEQDSKDEPIRAHLLQIAIVSNHMNGKDTHVRGLRVFAPRKPEITDDLIAFTSTEFKQHETIR